MIEHSNESKAVSTFRFSNLGQIVSYLFMIIYIYQRIFRLNQEMQFQLNRLEGL